jgi:protein-tyrosine-phosphatase
MAKAFYNHYTHSNNADAAGTEVKETGQTLLERKATSSSKNFFVLDVMNDLGIDMGSAMRNLLSEASLSTYDKVISMEDKEHSPSWLLSSPNYVFWDVSDTRGQDYKVTERIRDEIKQKVIDLIN